MEEVSKFLKLSERDREELIEIVNQHPVQQIIRALKNVTLFDPKSLKPKKYLSVEEFRRVVERTRY